MSTRTAMILFAFAVPIATGEAAALTAPEDPLAESPESALAAPSDAVSIPSAHPEPLAPGFSTVLAAPEHRAAWADAWHAGFLGASEVTDLVSTLAGANYNVVVAEVRKCGDAYYDSDYEPRATNISDPPPFDPLGDLVAKAHARGLRVHAWVVTYRIWSSNWGPAPPGHIWALHPEWAMKNSTGGILDGSYYNLDPGIPSVQDYICSVALDIVSKYDVDGFSWDYIRYPSGYTWGYNDITQQRFFDEYGFWPPTSTADSRWPVWADYRRRQVTDLVRKCSLEIWNLKPWVLTGVDTVGWSGGNPNLDFTQTRQYKEVFQDGKGWLERHIVDFNRVMNYKREYEPAQQSDYRTWTDFICHLGETTGRWGIGGQAAYLNAIADSITQMSYVRTRGCTGGSTYSYAATNKDGQPAADFFNAVRTSLYTSPAPLPAAPWKAAPATGTLFGNVVSTAAPADPIYRNWIYRATVTASGPVIETTLTDATGTYGFLDLPPGNYSVTAEKAGLPSYTHDDVALNAGDIVRRNFDLSDRDGDGHVTADDCDDGADSVWADPGEAHDLLFTSSTTLVWTAPADRGCDPSALTHDLLRAMSPSDFENATCLESDDGADTTATDAEEPAAGRAFAYLVRADNACPGQGPVGADSNGIQRSARPCP